MNFGRPWRRFCVEDFLFFNHIIIQTPMFKKVDPKVSFPKMEEEILEFWEKEKIFEKSVSNREGAKRYSFYDGPPFATGTPHYGHIVASTIKDAVPRYWTMRGYQVERRWGWDCHGLPIENIAEKELGISHKKEIETLGVAKFNEVCRSKVLEYVSEWKRVMHRFGRWADMENAYRTMDRDFMESVWWVFKELWDKGLIYESYRIMHICPRCETTLSQSEVAEGYKDVKDLSAVAKFELVDEPGTFVLAWTTTPWTLPGNVALAVGEDIEYVKVRQFAEISIDDSPRPEGRPSTGEYFLIVSKTFFEEKLKDDEWCLKMNLDFSFEEISSFKGSELVGKAYKPLFDCYSKDEKLQNRENGWKIYAAEFVNTEEGTGVVHIAPAFGEDDMALGKKENLPFVQHVNRDGTIRSEVGEGLEGFSVKPSENPQAMDVEIIKYLAKNDLLFSKEKYEHSYPHCWRCDTPLLNYATSSWFVRVAERKEKMIELANDINWSPEHIKAGRWGKWIEGARDWSISRQRYWASVMPIWRCSGNERQAMNNEQRTRNNISSPSPHSGVPESSPRAGERGCGAVKVFGSAEELEDASGMKIDDLHKHSVDGITVPCEKCGRVMRRVPDVLDTWFDSGSMPYGERHYPFENKETFDAAFPAQFIAEGVDQTRCWFYYLHVIATGIKETKAFQNVVVNGIVLAEDGRKMSKKLRNYPDPMDILEKYGSDVLRYYLLSSPVVAAENLNFSERDLSDIQRNLFRMLWNSYSFFMTYASVDKWEPKAGSRSASWRMEAGSSVMDRWILSELQLLIKEVNDAMEKYELNRASRAFMPFVDHLSNWYIRRSRKRFWKSEDDTDKNAAYQTLYEVLVTLSKLMAPFTPFIAEEVYRNLTGENSVHLAEYPAADENLIDEKLNDQMTYSREVINLGLKMRAGANIKVRQPLSRILISGFSFESTLLDIFKDELNVKDVKFVKNDEILEASKSGYTISSIVKVGTVFVSGKKSEPSKTFSLAIDFRITPELQLEGEAREIIRAIQEGRKKAGFNVEDRIALGYTGKEKVFALFGEMIAKEVLATEYSESDLKGSEYSEEVNIEGESFRFWLKRI